LQASPHVIRVINSRTLGWAERVACTGELKMHRKVCSVNLKERDHSEDVGVDDRLLGCILGKQGGKL